MAAAALKKGIDEAQKDSEHPLNREKRVRKGWTHPSTMNVTMLSFNLFHNFHQSFDRKVWIFFIYLLTYLFTALIYSHKASLIELKSIIRFENDLTAKVKIWIDGKLFPSLLKWKTLNGKHSIQKWFEDLLNRLATKILKYTVCSLYESKTSFCHFFTSTT